ncbi:hypothetical protein QL285_000291 [Trifolium repens]|nr:hypothetical protein QL285_000291 [Trifolium repens]
MSSPPSPLPPFTGEMSSPPPPLPPFTDVEAVIGIRRCSVLTRFLFVLQYVATSFLTVLSSTANHCSIFSSSNPTVSSNNVPSSSTTNHRNISSSPSNHTVSTTDAPSSSIPNHNNRRRFRLRNRTRCITLVQAQPQPQPHYDNTTQLLIVFLASNILWSTFLKTVVVLMAFHIFDKMFFGNSHAQRPITVSSEMQPILGLNVVIWRMVVKFIIGILVFLAVSTFFSLP